MRVYPAFRLRRTGSALAYHDMMSCRPAYSLPCVIVYLIVIYEIIASAEVYRPVIVLVLRIAHQHQRKVLSGYIFTHAEGTGCYVGSAHTDGVFLAPEQSVLIPCAVFHIRESRCQSPDARLACKLIEGLGGFLSCDKVVCILGVIVLIVGVCRRSRCHGQLHGIIKAEKINIVPAGGCVSAQVYRP